MKKVVCLALAIVLTLSVTITVGTDQGYAASSVKHLSLKLYPKMKSIDLKWKKKNNIVSYAIYKKDVTKEYNKGTSDLVRMSKYKKIANVKRTKNTYRDRKVKSGHMYAYVVKGYRWSGGKKKLAYTSYIKDSCQLDCPGLAVPDLMNIGYGEFYTNSKNCLFLFYQKYYGADPSSYVVYRKAKGEQSYKKIKVKIVEKGKDTSVFKDTTVKPGTTYYYAIKTRKKTNGKYRYSKYSNIIRIPAVNFNGTFKLEVFRDETMTDEIVVKMTSDQFNGALTFRRWIVEDGSASEDLDDRTLYAYSNDGKIWTRYTSGTFKLYAGGTIFLKFKGKDINRDKSITFDEGSVDYDGPGNGKASLSLNLVNNTGEVFQVFD